MTTRADDKNDNDNQTALPGGLIGPAEPWNEEASTWRRPAGDGPPHVPDTALERTSLRWADGWYVVTSAPGDGPAMWRRGPFTECAKAENTLLLIAGIPADDRPPAGMPTTDAQTPPPGGGASIADPPPELLLDTGELTDRIYDRAEQICDEGQANRLYHACRRWIREVEKRPGTADHRENKNLGASGDDSPAEVKKAHDEVLAHARAYEIWGEH